jgi:GxxExxY protein
MEGWGIIVCPMHAIKKDIIERELSYQLMGMFFRIHRELGRFCRERQYSDALEIELRQSKLPYEREKAYLVAGRYSNRADFVVDGRIIIELKTRPFLHDDDFSQMKRYLQSSGIRLGLVVNFRSIYINPRRVLNPSMDRNGIQRALHS